MAEAKPHQASKRKLNKLKKDGKIPKYQILSAGVRVLFTILLLSQLVGPVWVRNRILLKYCWLYGAHEPIVCLRLGAFLLVTNVLIYLSFQACLAVGLEFLFQRPVWAPGLLAPQSHRLFPSGSWSRIATGIKQLPLLGCGSIIVGSSVVWMTFRQIVAPPFVFYAAWGKDLTFLQELLFNSLAYLGGAFLLVGLMDFVLRRRAFFCEAAMSHTELKKEICEEEGNPLFRSARRSLHEMLVHEDLVSRIKKSKVIVVKRKKTAGTRKERTAL